MSVLPRLITGILVVFAFSWLGVAAYSYLELGHMQPFLDEASGQSLPPALSGMAVAGSRVYAANGCVYCHTQQVRPAYLSSDIEKQVGPRRTVARDYLFEPTAFLGSQRVGQDLSNIGIGADAQALHRHLYEPTEVVPNSVMPSFRFLYKLQKIQGQPSTSAIQGLTGPHAPKAGEEVLPSEDAKVLVAYLLSQKRDYPLPEAPLK